MRQAQRCTSHQPYHLIEVPSRSQQGVIYEVYSIFPDDPPEEYICPCRGFRYRGECEHQHIAHDHRCMWMELEGPEQQNEREKREFVCPRCGGETFNSMEPDD